MKTIKLLAPSITPASTPWSVLVYCAQVTSEKQEFDEEGYPMVHLEFNAADYSNAFTFELGLLMARRETYMGSDYEFSFTFPKA